MNNDPKTIALGKLLGWFTTVRTVDGYTGPVVSFRANSMRFTGPGNDWRIEGLLKGYLACFHGSRDSKWLDRVELDMKTFLSAQRKDGFFENSYFEKNPFEGGMPHEPAVLAACCQANRVLQQHGRALPELDDIVRRYLDDVLTKKLWNKSMRFVRDWEISDYQYTNSATCAAMLGLIAEWSDNTGVLSMYAEYAEDLTGTLIGLQVQKGVLSGGVFSNNRPGAGISPFLAARCLQPLRKCARLYNLDGAGASADRLHEFLIDQALASGGYKRLLWPWRPASSNPIVSGAVAQVLGALIQDGYTDKEGIKVQEQWLLSLQQPSGAFRHAIGYGNASPNLDQSEWRDLVAAAGWQDKIFHWLSLRSAKPSVDEVASESWETSTRVKGRAGRFRETPEEVEIYRGEELFYRWQKGRRLASVCRLS